MEPVSVHLQRNLHIDINNLPVTEAMARRDNVRRQIIAHPRRDRAHQVGANQSRA